MSAIGKTCPAGPLHFNKMQCINTHESKTLRLEAQEVFQVSLEPKTWKPHGRSPFGGDYFLEASVIPASRLLMASEERRRPAAEPTVRRTTMERKVLHQANVQKTIKNNALVLIHVAQSYSLSP